MTCARRRDMDRERATLHCSLVRAKQRGAATAVRNLDRETSVYLHSALTRLAERPQFRRHWSYAFSPTATHSPHTGAELRPPWRSLPSNSSHSYPFSSQSSATPRCAHSDHCGTDTSRYTLRPWTRHADHTPTILGPPRHTDALRPFWLGPPLHADHIHSNLSSSHSPLRILPLTATPATSFTHSAPTSEALTATHLIKRRARVVEAFVGLSPTLDLSQQPILLAQAGGSRP